MLRARAVPVPRSLVRALVDLTWRLHAQPTEPGWVDLAVALPLMDPTRARRDLGWVPRHRADDALRATLEAMAAGRGAAAPVLRPRARGIARLREAARALVPGSGRTG